MSDDLDRILDAVTRLPSPAEVDDVFGTSVTSGTRILVPVAEVAYDFEMTAERVVGERAHQPGAALEPDSGWGHARARPVAVIELGPTGVLIKPILDAARILPKVLLLAAWTASCVAVAMGIKDAAARRRRTK